MTTIHQTHDFILNQAKLNIEFIKASPANVSQGKQINTALANIVASERNIIMHNALERMKGNDLKNLQGL